MKLAIVYDRITKLGGAERVLMALHAIWPEAPFYTAIYDPHTTPWAKNFEIHPSFINRLPGAKKHHEWYFGATPLAFESFDLSAYDVVFSVCSDFTKGVITRPGKLHLSYIFSPTRYLWLDPQEYRRWGSFLLRPFLPPVLHKLRQWDYLAAQRPDHILTISRGVKHQIQKYYHRDSTVIYPPVDTDFFKPADNYFERQRETRFGAAGSYFLIVSRLVPRKNLSLAIAAFNQLKLPLKIIGTGRQLPQLQALAGPTVEFLGELTDTKVLRYYQNCQALIFPGEEAFGLTMVEALACGKPIIAWRQGGATEIVTPDTGVFFNRSTVTDLVKAVQDFPNHRFNWQKCRASAQGFSLDKFKTTMQQTVESYL